MKRSWHVQRCHGGGKWYTLDSTDTYELAVDRAKIWLAQADARDGIGLQVTHAGVIVWGPYFAGGKHQPAGMEVK